MRRAGGRWAFAVMGMVTLGCSSTVSDTHAYGDAAVTMDAVADAALPPPIDPCADDHIVDLDRVGVATASGVGAVVDLRSAPEMWLDPSDPLCTRLYRPVVLRLRAPRDGRLRVLVNDGADNVVSVRRVTGCGTGTLAVSCHAPRLYIDTDDHLVPTLDDLRAGEVVDVAVGLQSSLGTVYIQPPGPVAVTVQVIPTLTLGAACGGPYIPAADLCGPSLACPVDGPNAHYCQPAGGLGGPCDPSRSQCAAGQRCDGWRCVTAAPVGAPCTPGSFAGCTPDVDCVARGEAGVCAPRGTLGAAPRRSLHPCDDGLVATTDRCVLAGNTAGVCDSELHPCADPARCVAGTPSRCVLPGLRDGACAVVDGAPACGAGLACREGTCVPALALGDPCFRPVALDSATCGEGLLCQDSRCAPLPALGQPCVVMSSAAGCAAGLACDDGTCHPAPIEGEACRGVCAAGLRCTAHHACRRQGALDGLCRDAAPHCDAGLGCNNGQCVATSVPGTNCVLSNDSVCTPPLVCTSIDLPSPGGCFPRPIPCDKGCADGRVCREGECVVDGRCDRPGRDAPQPCGDGRYCMSVDLGTFSCLTDGTRGGRCRATGATACDGGLVCARNQCVPVLAGGAACDVDYSYRGVCGAGLRCGPPDDCLALGGACVWAGDGTVPGICRPEPAGGALGGVCTRAGDGTPRCDGALFCNPATLRCAAVAVSAPCDEVTVFCPAGQRCANDGYGMTCVAAGAYGTLCRLGGAAACDDGLVCSDPACEHSADCSRGAVCIHRFVEGEECDGAVQGLCVDGLTCAQVPGDYRCLRTGAAGAPCNPDSVAPRCAVGLACVGTRCAPGLATGAVCDGSVPCEDGTGCGPGAVLLRVCRVLGTEGAPCADDAGCRAELACRGECVPRRAAGAACDPAGVRDACEVGFVCEGGVCRAPPAGLVCAPGFRCRDGLRCVDGRCAQLGDPGAACGPESWRSCRDDSGCVGEGSSGVCRLLGSDGGPCRRVTGDGACDAGLRCDVRADRCGR